MMNIRFSHGALILIVGSLHHEIMERESEKERARESIDATVKAEMIIQFIDKKLEGNESTLALKLLERLRSRYKDRKNNQLVSLVKFYKDPDSLTKSSNNEDSYKMVSKPTIVKMSKALHRRLRFDRAETDELSSTANEQSKSNPRDSSEGADTRSNTEDSSIPLAKELSSLLTQSNRSQQDGLSDTFTKEISLFMTGGAVKKTQALKELSRSLLTVPPTSVEAERTFSASGLFLTKLRCRLSDASLDMLIFLKLYFSCTKS